MNGPQTPEDQEQFLTNQGSSDNPNPAGHVDVSHVSQESSHVTSQPEQNTPENEDAPINSVSSAVTPLVSQVDLSH